ncbi:MAG TPA: 3'-5' exonuclease [Burkholderiales bacterium]|nr:3'-5' exonuclease [Burkholderiales bacterium]
MQSISREQLANLPIRRYDGRVRLIETLQDLDQARADLRQERIVGLDTETRPAFRAGEVHLPCLVQAATAHAVYLFQLRRVDVHPLIAELMADAHIVKAGVGVAHDLRQLKLVFPFIEHNVVDLGVAARRCGLEQTGVRNLAGMLLGFRIPKGNRTSNWAVPRLSPAQVAYAATDAWACRELYLRFDTLGLLQAGVPAGPARGARLADGLAGS